MWEISGGNDDTESCLADNCAGLSAAVRLKSFGAVELSEEESAEQLFPRPTPHVNNMFL